MSFIAMDPVRVISLSTYYECMSLNWRDIALKSLTDAEIQSALIRHEPLALPSGFANGVVWFYTRNPELKRWWTLHRCPSAKWMPYSYEGMDGWLMGFKHQGYSVFENYFGADTQAILAKVFADTYDPSAERRLINECPMEAPHPYDYIVDDQPLIIDSIGIGYLFGDGGALHLDGCAGLDPFSCVTSIIYRREWYRNDQIWSFSRSA